MHRKKLARASGKLQTGNDRLQSESRAALRRLTRRDLRNLARREGLKGWSRLNKEELVQALGFLRTLSAAGAVEGAPKSQTVCPPRALLRAEEEAFLPEAYGETRLVLMPIDPFWVHAYWELSAQDEREMCARAEKGAGRARWILRVYDVTGIPFEGSNAHSSFDVEISPPARNWYINLWSPQKSLGAELGLVAPDGTFFPLTRSNVAHTPAAWISPHTEESWMKVDWRPQAALQPHSCSGKPLPMWRGEPEDGASPVPAARGDDFSRPVPVWFETAAAAPPLEVLEPDPPTGLGQKKLISPEEYHRFLEGTPGRNRFGKEQIPLSTGKISALEMAARSFESGLSSYGLIRSPCAPTDTDPVS